MTRDRPTPSLLVTGGSGFLGAHVVERARAAWPIVQAQTRVSPLPNGGPLVFAISLEDGDELDRWLEVIRPTAVIHCAALARIADCERDPELARRVNVVATAQIAAWCAANRARLVHVSTDLVFGAAHAPAGGFSETSKPGPLSVYGRTKLEAEEAVLRAQAGASIVRLPLLLGPSHGRGLGATDSILAAVARGETPSLFEDEWRTPLDVRSAAEALLELAAKDFAGVLHVAGPERLSRFEIGLRALRRTGLRDDQARAKLVRTTRAAAGQAARPADVSLDSSRARSLLSTLLVGLESGST